jgi:hypothetical protein
MKQGVGFSGNIIFQSHNAFRKLTLSRRDDLLSVANLLVYLIKGGFKWVNRLNNLSPLLEQVTKIKLSITPENLCALKAATFLPVVKEIFSYGFKDEPNYTKIKHMMRLVLLDKDIVPC